jgi:hypothetical protein
MTQCSVGRGLKFGEHHGGAGKIARKVWVLGLSNMDLCSHSSATRTAK